jgi:hypothetical protein
VRKPDPVILVATHVRLLAEACAIGLCIAVVIVVVRIACGGA